MKLFATETETCVLDRATLIAPTKVSLPCKFPPENKTWNLHGATLVCSQEGGPARFPGATTPPPPPGRETKFMRLLTDFKKKMEQTEFHARHLVHLRKPVNSLLLKHNAAQLIWVSKLHQQDQTRRRHYHKTIPVVFASRLLQIGDNQGPNANDVGNDVDQMWHTQVVGQVGLFQSGTGGHPIRRLSAL